MHASLGVLPHFATSASISAFTATLCRIFINSVVLKVFLKSYEAPLFLTTAVHAIKVAVTIKSILASATTTHSHRTTTSLAATFGSTILKPLVLLLSLLKDTAVTPPPSGLSPALRLVIIFFTALISFFAIGESLFGDHGLVN